MLYIVRQQLQHEL
jgi:hypothetical protein